MEGAVSERRKAFAVAHRSDEDRQAYISASQRASSVIAKAKAEAWQTTCSSLLPRSNPKSVHSLLCSIAGSPSSSSSSPNFPNRSSPRESASVYAAYLTLSFSKPVSLLRAKFFPCVKALRCISASSWGPSKESLSLLYESFLWPLITYASPGWFPFLNSTNLTKLECLHQAASRAITSCLSSSPIPLLLMEAFLPPLLVTLTHFTLSSYERAFCLPTSFPISGLARLGVKPRLCRSSWRAFASTRLLMLPSTCSREALLACPPCPPWNLPLFTVECTLPTPCSRSDPPHFCQGAALVHLDSPPS